MSDEPTFTVRDETDIVAARMQVRNLARAAGMDIGDQARISLAASSAARVLLPGAFYDVQIAVHVFARGTRQGVRVICTGRSAAHFDLESDVFSEMRRLVDEMACENRPPNIIQITLIKWPGSGAAPLWRRASALSM